MKPPTKRYHVDIFHHFVSDPRLTELAAQLEALSAKETLDMSVISDKIAELGVSVDASIVRVQEDVADQAAKIAKLEALVAQGGASQADMDALQALKDKVDALDPVKPDTLPE